MPFQFTRRKSFKEWKVFGDVPDTEVVHGLMSECMVHQVILMGNIEGQHRENVSLHLVFVWGKGS